MPYGAGSRLPGEAASKLGHVAVINSDWVKSLVSDFEKAVTRRDESELGRWEPFDVAANKPLRHVWAVDGSFASVATTERPPREVAFVKAALLLLDTEKLKGIDKKNPHPLLLQDLMAESAVFHSTVFPLKNIRTSMGTNYDTVRHIVRDSIKLDQDGLFYETLKWLAYEQWGPPQRSPAFECPHCGIDLVDGLPTGADESLCDRCHKPVFLTDMIGFHLAMTEDSAPDAVASGYMLVVEHLMLFTAIRLLWHHAQKSLVSETLFIKDGPLTLRSQYSKLVPPIRRLLAHAKSQGRPIHVIGQEKSGTFFDHLASISRQVRPSDRGEPPACLVLSHKYVREEVQRAPDLANPYGKRTNWGEKVYVKLDPGFFAVLSIPTGAYSDADTFPTNTDLIGLDRILATLPSLISHKHEGALFPVELANGVASMSSYPSARILQRFLEGTM